MAIKDATEQSGWNQRWPKCLLGLDELIVQLQEITAEDNGLGEFLKESTKKMDRLLQGQTPPDSDPGDYKYGPVLPIIHYGLPGDSLAEKHMAALRGLSLFPKSPISKEEWERDLRILNGAGQVTSDGSLVAHSDLAIADYCWIIAALKYLLLKLKPNRRHEFVKASEVIRPAGSPRSLTLAMAGDWGSGRWNDPDKVYPAETVLTQMLATEPDYMVHLGDVYYAGTPSDSLIDPDEEGRYFTDLWKPGSRGALALNSNHEMYSGANGLYEALENPMFAAQRGATYFAIEFEDWLVLGLDSAFYDNSLMFMHGALNDPDQNTFIENLNPQDKLVLVLTHHNGLLYNGKKKQPLWGQVCDALGKQPEVWYWGHIHNGIVYSSESEAGTTLARCCGHGSLPFGDAYGLHDAEGQRIPAVSYYAHTPLPDPTVPPQQLRVLNGFATVCLEKGKITEAFYEQSTDAAAPPVWEKTTTF